MILMMISILVISSISVLCIYGVYVLINHTSLEVDGDVADDFYTTYESAIIVDSSHIPKPYVCGLMAYTYTMSTSTSKSTFKNSTNLKVKFDVYRREKLAKQKKTTTIVTVDGKNGDTRQTHLNVYQFREYFVLALADSLLIYKIYTNGKVKLVKTFSDVNTLACGYDEVRGTILVVIANKNSRERSLIKYQTKCDTVIVRKFDNIRFGFAQGVAIVKFDKLFYVSYDSRLIIVDYVSDDRHEMVATTDHSLAKVNGENSVVHYSFFGETEDKIIVGTCLGSSTYYHGANLDICLIDRDCNIISGGDNRVYFNLDTISRRLYFLYHQGTIATINGPTIRRTVDGIVWDSADTNLPTAYRSFSSGGNYLITVRNVNSLDLSEHVFLHHVNGRRFKTILPYHLFEVIDGGKHLHIAQGGISVVVEIEDFIKNGCVELPSIELLQ